MLLSGIRWRRSAGRAEDMPQGEQRSIIRRIIGNLMHLAGGNGLAALIGTMTLAVTAHALGPVALGIFAIIESYGKLWDQVIRLETWQATIRYGARLLELGSHDEFRRLIKLCVAADCGGAILAGLVAFLAVPLVARWLYWSEDVALMAQIYSLSLMFGISSAPVGVLRLFDKFALIAWLEPALGLARLLGAISIAMMNGGLFAFLLLNMTLMIAQRLILAGVAYQTLLREGHSSFIFAPLARSLRHFDGFWSFVVASNGAVLLRKVTQECDILVVGHVAGAHAAGLYQIVRKLTMTATKLGGMFQQVVFPDLARLWARGKVSEFLQALRNLELMTLAFGLTIVGATATAGSTVIFLVAGEGFEDAVTPLLLQSVALLMFLSGSALRPAIMSMGYQVQQFWIVAISALTFFVTLFWATPQFGVVGAPLAHIAFNIIWLPASLLLFVAALRRERAKKLPAAPMAARL